MTTTAWAWDTETALIEVGWQAPPIVCVTEQYVDASTGATTAPALHHWTTSRELVGDNLLSPQTLIVGHNVAYDLRVVCAQWPEFLPLVVNAYEQDRVTDTMLRQKLLDIAAGKYRGYRDPVTAKWRKVTYELVDVVTRHSPLALTKDAWRLSYGWFRDTPLAQWTERAVEVQALSVPLLEQARQALALEPKKRALKDRVAGLEAMIADDPTRCVTYAVDDARATCDIFISQEKHSKFLEDEFRLARRMWALGLMSAWGLRTDEVGVRLLENETRQEYEEIKTFLTDIGWVRANGTRDTKLPKKAMVELCKREGLRIPRTPAWDPKKHAAGEKGFGEYDCVSLTADSCVAVDDEALHAYAMFSTLTKMLSNDIKAVLQGIHYPIHSRFDLAETGRTTSSKPNVQNWRRAALHDDEDDE